MVCKACVWCVDAKTPAVTVNGSVDATAAGVVGNNIDGDDDRWEQVRSRNRTVFSNTVYTVDTCCFSMMTYVAIYTVDCISDFTPTNSLTIGYIWRVTKYCIVLYCIDCRI